MPLFYLESSSGFFPFITIKYNFLSVHHVLTTGPAPLQHHPEPAVPPLPH